MPRSLIVALILLLCARCTAAADLRTFSTDHYIIHTDLDADLATDLGHRMEVMWDEYSRRLADFSPPQDGPKLEAYLFARRHDYMRLTGDRFPNTGGIFIPAQHLLAAFLETQGRDGLRRTLQHEAFHQFANAAIGGRMPIWLNEGIAQIFEEGIWTGNGFLLGQVAPKRVRQLQDDLREDRITDFRTFLSMTDEQWASNLRYKPIAQTQYNQAWAMVQFLITATDENGQPKYRDRLIDMLGLIRAGRDGHDAFVDSFSDNYFGFQNRFYEWAHTLRPTAEAAYAEHQAVLADMIVSLDQHGRQFGDIASFHQFLDTGGYHVQSGSTKILPSIFFCDLAGRPLGPSQLFFAPAPGSSAPDLLCRPANDLRLRTRFLRSQSGVLDYETVVESE
jgi:hypothetical protein